MSTLPLHQPDPATSSILVESDTWVDTIFKRLVSDIVMRGDGRMDRTGTGTFGVFGRLLRLDLSANKLPLLSLKKTHWKSVVEELLWFLRGETNVRSLQEKGVTIWDDWLRPYTLNRPLVWVDCRVKDYVPYSGDFGTGTAYGQPQSIEDKLRQTWSKMMRRCYDTTAHNYNTYGGTGASVCLKWHDCRTFIGEVQQIPHWRYKLRSWDEFELDKDYYGANQYGPDTCVWLSSGENNAYMSSATPVQATTTSGQTIWGVSQGHLAKQLGMSTTTLHRFIRQGVPTVLKGDNKRFIGWSFDELETFSDCNLRLELIEEGELGRVYGSQWRNWGGEIDQIQNVIDSIKSDPFGRRHIVSAWNPSDVPHMALPPCHMMFQFYVSSDEDGEPTQLSCHMYQRSADVFLGVPFNIASYALLTKIIAFYTGLYPKELVISFGDLHLYSNHMQQVSELLAREAQPDPSLVLVVPYGTSFDKLRMENFNLKDYTPHAPIKAPIAV